MTSTNVTSPRPPRMPEPSGWTVFALLIAGLALSITIAAQSAALGLALVCVAVIATVVTTCYNERVTAPAPATGNGRRIVGLSGYAGSGKDTAAQGLLWVGFTRVSFADKIRAFAYAQNPLIEVRPNDALYPDVEALWSAGDPGSIFVRLQNLVDGFGWERAKYEVRDVRDLLQRTGTDAGRKVIGENVWVDAVMADLPEGDVVFTDLRFPNEAQAITDAGGRTVRISRLGVYPVNGHASEYALDAYPFDHWLTNDADEHAVGKALRTIVENWPQKS